MIKWLTVSANIAPVALQPALETRIKIIERHVVIARHDKFWKRQPIEKRARFDKLTGARALRQIAGNRNQIRSQFVDCLGKWTDGVRSQGAEVKVG